ncbi:hypothetical protein HMPREF2596_02655 [Neisseria sp. HMSC078C12]|nr:hypothetical protein HMPREF2596_02655 [Neisseria sp. HMSC078C12]
MKYPALQMKILIYLKEMGVFLNIALLTHLVHCLISYFPLSIYLVIDLIAVSKLLCDRLTFLYFYRYVLSMKTRHINQN